MRFYKYALFIYMFFVLMISSFAAYTPTTSGTALVYQGTTPWVTSGTAAVLNTVKVEIVSGSTTGGLTNSELRETPVDVNVTSGTITANVTFPASLTVNQGTSPWITSGSSTITNFPTTQDVRITSSTIDITSDGLTNDELRASPIDVNVDFPISQTVDQGSSPWITSGTSYIANFPSLYEIFGSVAVNNFPSLYQVSGTVTALQGTSPWIVSGTVNTNLTFPASFVVNQGTNPWITSGSMTVDNVVATSSTGTTQVAGSVGVTGTVTSNQGTSPWITSGTINNTVATSATGITQVAGTVTANVTFPSSQTVNQGTSPWITSGSMTVGNVVATSSTGTTQVAGNVGVTGTVTVNQGASPWITSGTINNVVAVSSTGTAQITGTVTSDQGTSPWITSGTINNTVAVSATGTTPVSLASVPTHAVTQGTSPWITSGTVTSTVTNFPTSTTVFQGTSPWATSGTINNTVATSATGTTQIAGTVTSNQGTSPWITSGTINNVVATSSTGVTQISGTISGVATAANQTNGTQQTMLVDSQGVKASMTPYGRQAVTIEGSTRMVDKFDGTLDTNKWTITQNNGGVVSTTTGSLTITLGTGTGNGGRIDSVPRFDHPGNAYLQNGMSLCFEAGGLATNTKGVFGFATGGGNYTTAATDGVYFYINGTSMTAVVNKNNTEIFNPDITSFVPTDGGCHRYDIIWNTQNLTFRINGINVASSTAGVNPSVQTLPARIMRINGSSTPNKTPVTQSQAFAITDTAHNNILMSDPTYPWQMAGVTASGSLRITDDGSAQAGTVVHTNGTAVTSDTVVPSSATFPISFIMCENRATLTPMRISFDGGSNYKTVDAGTTFTWDKIRASIRQFQIDTSSGSAAYECLIQRDTR